jgi:hypothetical protein
MNGHKASLSILVLTSLLLFHPAVVGGEDGQPERDSRATYLLRSSVIGASGAAGTSTSFREQGTLGQPTPVGTGTSTSFDLYAGFWTGWQTATGIPEHVQPEVPRNALLPNAPNPFNPLTTISYEVGETARVRLAIYNIRGQAVRELVDAPRSPGRYAVVWDGRDCAGKNVASGVYLCCLRVGSFRDEKKMLLIK